MNKTTSTIQDQHHQIQFLLPWYVNQSLQQHEQRLVENHIRHCLPCRRELNGLRKLAEAVTHDIRSGSGRRNVFRRSTDKTASKSI